MHDVGYYSPESLQEVLDIIDRVDDTKILAGGTDVVPSLNEKMIPWPQNIVSIKNIKGLRNISKEKDSVKIGCLATFTEIIGSELIKDEVPNLWEASYLMGNPAIRNKGTIGGNIVNASPFADSVVALMACNARVKIQSLNEGKEIPLAKFFIDNRTTVLKANEILTEIIIPMDSNKTLSKFRRVSISKGSSMPIVNMALEGEFDGTKCISMRIALGSVNKTVVRLSKVEDNFIGKEINEEVINEALKDIEKDISPIDNGMASAWYRTKVSKNMIKETLQNI